MLDEWTRHFKTLTVLAIALATPAWSGEGGTMAASETQTPGTFADDASVGTAAWANPANAGASDDVYAIATAGLMAPEVSHYLLGTNCGFTIPARATITGIKLRIERKSDLGLTTDSTVRLSVNGSYTGANKALLATWPNVDAYVEYGGPNDLWDSDWTPALVNGPTFGAGISAFVAMAESARIDHMEITVYYVLVGEVHARVEHHGPGLSRYVVQWQADELGAVALRLDGIRAPRLEGDIRRVETKPSATNPPTANYDLTLADELGADLLGGACLNRSDTDPEAAYPHYAAGTSGHGERATGGVLYFTIANAGEDGAGCAAFYLLEP